MKALPNLVSIGSISAARLLAEGFPEHRERITAIVPTTDTGSSTGIIRERFHMPAPGDVRAVLAAMGDEHDERSRLLKKLVQYRFSEERFPELGAMAVGNLILAALTELCGNFSQAVRTGATLLGVKGRVLPVTSAYTQIGAVLEDGSRVVGEKEVRRPGKARIQRLFLVHEPVPLEDGIADAVYEADLILIGPGCLYTSVIATLVMPGLVDLLHTTKATSVFCCNSTTTPGQTDGMSVLDHVRTIITYLGDHPPDYVLLNNRRPDPAVEQAYTGDKVFPLVVDEHEPAAVQKLGSIPILADLIEDTWNGKRLLHKVDTIRHDPRKVRSALLDIV